MPADESVLRRAVAADVPIVVDLINRAFAVEKFFKSGERIDADGLTEMMTRLSPGDGDRIADTAISIQRLTISVKFREDRLNVFGYHLPSPGLLSAAYR